MIKPSREQFKAYIRVQYSGVTNMLDIPVVCELAGEGLTKEHCLYIYKHYSELYEEYTQKEVD